MYVREFALFTFCNWELLYFVSIYKGYDTGKRYIVTPFQNSRRNISSELLEVCSVFFFCVFLSVLLCALLLYKLHLILHRLTECVILAFKVNLCCSCSVSAYAAVTMLAG
jgi:hypothetical protein